MIDFLNRLDIQLCNKILKKRNVMEYVLHYGKEQEILEWIGDNKGL